jgi:hypothetical protein
MYCEREDDFDIVQEKINAPILRKRYRAPILNFSNILEFVFFLPMWCERSLIIMSCQRYTITVNPICIQAKINTRKK